MSDILATGQRAKRTLEVLARPAALPHGTRDRGVPVVERVGGIEHAWILEDLSARLGAYVIVCDAADRIRWVTGRVLQEFPGEFCAGQEFHRALEKVTVPVERSTYEGPRAARRTEDPPPETRMRSPGGSDAAVYYRHIRFTPNVADGSIVHCLVETTAEEELEESLRNNLIQLASMREIIDTLYESLGTREVLYLILIAVTADRGFGFNRAFYLEAIRGQLRGRMGIGPSSHEDAHRIWQRLDHLNLRSLRDLYQDLTRGGETPDPPTADLASRMRFGIGSEPEGRLLGAIESRKPALLHAGDLSSPVDRELFEVLATDAIAVVPLYVRDSLAGVLIADNFVTRKQITSYDLDVLKTFSGYAGVALERSQLYDELHESITKLKEANEELKKHHQRLIQAEKLSALGKLAACVSHEIRNPLAMIGGHARSLLRDGVPGGDVRESLEIIASEVERLERFLRETLDFAKPEVTTMKPADLRDEVQSCLSRLRREIEDRALEVELDLGEEPLSCLLDPELFHRALSNLVRNSIEAIGRMGRIYIRASIQGHWARLEIADSGPGIPPELHSRVFEPFFTTKREGTGLGMAIAAESIRTLGGEISLQADDKHTSIFVIALPLEERRLRRRPAAPAPTEKERISS